MGANPSRRLDLNFVARWLIYLFLAAPYGLLLLKIGNIKLSDTDELVWALENTLSQAVLSGVLAVIGGFFLALGWGSLRLQLNSFFKNVIEWLLIAPSFLPPIFILLVGFSLVSHIPRGVLGIGLFHAFMNMGLLAVGFEKNFRGKLSGLADMAYVAGCGPLLFWRKALHLIRVDLVLGFLFVFAMSLSSLSIPLMVGGGDGTTLEVLIYEKIRISNAWDEALFLAFLQWALIFVVGFFPSWEKPWGELIWGRAVPCCDQSCFRCLC